MTLTDIARMLKYAKVPRSKTVEILWPKPCVMVHVPAQYVPVIRAVVSQLALPHQAVTIDVLNTLDVLPNEHVLFKIKGATHAHTVYPDGCGSVEQRRRRKESLRARNSEVVIDFARVAS